MVKSILNRKFTILIEDIMKFKFQNRPSRKEEDDVNGWKMTTVTKVRIFKAETPTTESPVITPPVHDMTKESQPPSPICVKEQVEFDARMVDGEEKEADIVADSNTSHIELASNSSISSAFCTGDVSAHRMHCETTERWKELRKVIDNKIEDMHGKYFDSLGEYAMTAVDKNRNEIDELLKTIDSENCMADTMNSLWDNENQAGEGYDSPIMTCDDVHSYLTSSEATSGKENNSMMMVKLPSV